jgi:hypothetical protein
MKSATSRVAAFSTYLALFGCGTDGEPSSYHADVADGGAARTSPSAAGSLTKASGGARGSVIASVGAAGAVVAGRDSGGSAGSAGASSAGASGSGDGGALATGRVLLFEDFDDATLPTSLGLGAQAGGQVELSNDPAQTYGGVGRSLRGGYPLATGGVYVWGVANVAAEQTRDVWVRFRARMPSQSPQGLKFLKVFGGHDGGYANTTFGTDYTGEEAGSMRCVSFGDGTETENDTQNIILFDGTDASIAGRAVGRPGYSALTPTHEVWHAADWGTGWHLFELHVKFNSGTTSEKEVNDGELFVRIDGKVYLDAKGLYNRHPSNPPIERVEIFGWAQGGTAPFELWYDNVEIAIGGFGDSPV